MPHPSLFLCPRVGALAWALALVCVAPVAHADADPDANEDGKPTLHYALGAIVSTGPDYAGGDGRKNSLRPAWAIEYGRFRLSTSRGSAFMGHGLRPRESGLYEQPTVQHFPHRSGLQWRQWHKHRQVRPGSMLPGG